MDGAPTSSPVGRLGEPIRIEPGTNASDTIEGIDYSGHALDQMQGRGLTPSTVKEAIEQGVARAGNNGRTIFYDANNKVTVIVEKTGEVVTAYPGGK